MKIRFIEEGNLSSWLRLILVLLGIGLAAIAIGIDLPVVWARILVFIGFAISLVGGMTSRAKLLQIQPFDNSYKKARKGYEVGGVDQREQNR